MLQVAVTGASGRMGGAFMEHLEGHDDVQALAVEGSACLDKICPTKAPDVIVDFSFPDATLDFAAWGSSKKVPMVIGTTGFTLAQLDRLADTLHSVPALLSPNMSLMMIEKPYSQECIAGSNIIFPNTNLGRT